MNLGLRLRWVEKRQPVKSHGGTENGFGVRDSLGGILQAGAFAMYE